MVSFSVYSKPIKTCFFKVISLFFTWNESFIHAWFCNTLTWSLKKLRLLSYAHVPNIAIFYYTIPKKSPFINITTDHIRKVFHYWEGVKSKVEMQVLNFHFCLKALIWSLAIKTVSCFPWSDTLIFEKIPAKYSGLHNHSLSVVLSSIHVLQEKVAVVPCNSNDHRTTIMIQ